MPAVTRIGDADITHCTQGFRLEGAEGSTSTAPKVFTNQTGESISSLGGKGGQGAEFAITQTGTTYSAGIPTKPGLGYRIGDKIETPCGATVTVAEIFPGLGAIKSISVSGDAPPIKTGGVFANGIGISRQGDLSTVHNGPPHKDTHPHCTPHQAPIARGSSTVFVNGRGCGRVGDKLSGCTAVAQGSPNVFAGG
jgi:uncharacterized Zn-binding protein involved in type VI secretion